MRYVIILLALTGLISISPSQAEGCYYNVAVLGSNNGVPYFDQSVLQQETIIGSNITKFGHADSRASADSSNIHLAAGASASRYGDTSEAKAAVNFSCELQILSDNGEPIGETDTFSLDFAVMGNMEAGGAAAGAMLDVTMSAQGGVVTGIQSQQFTYKKWVKSYLGEVTGDFSRTLSGPGEMSASLKNGTVTVTAAATLIAGASGALVDGKDKGSHVDAAFGDTISLFLTFSNPHLYAVDANGNIWSRPSAAPVPIPGAAWLFGSSLLAILFPARSRRLTFDPTGAH